MKYSIDFDFLKICFTQIQGIFENLNLYDWNMGELLAEDI